MRGKGSSRASRSTLVLALLVLGVVAVATGYFLGRAALSFLGGAPAAEPPGTPPASVPASGSPGGAGTPGGSPGAAPGGAGTVPGSSPGAAPGGAAPPATLRLSTVTLFRVQAGMFAEFTNARLLAEKLQEQGFAVAVSPAAPYRVVAGLHLDRGVADRTAQALRAGGQEVYVAAWALNAEPVRAGVAPTYLEFLESELEGMAGLVAREALVWDGYWLEGPGGLVGKTEPLEQEARRLAVAAVGATLPPDLAGLQDQLVQVTGAGVRSVYELRALENARVERPGGSYAAFMEMVLGYDSLVRGLGGGGA